MKLSCGVVLVNEHQEIFLAHVTCHNHWDIPKGVALANEPALDAAVRETREETGLVLTPASLLDLGEHKYLAGKRLHLFGRFIPKGDITPASCRCESHFQHFHARQHLPEMNYSP